MKRIISVLLSLFIIFIIFCEPVFANDVVVYHRENAYSDMIDIYSQDDNVEISDRAGVDYYVYNTDFRINYNSFTLLNVNQLKLYNAIKNSPIGTKTVTVSFPVGELRVDELNKNFLSEIMYAVCNDLPQLFYHAGYRASYSYTDTGYVVEIYYEIQLMETNIQIDDKLINAVTTYDFSTIATCWNKLQNVLNKLEFDTSNRYNFIKDVHDFLCNSIIYPDFDSVNYVADCHDAYGALVSGYAVCQGYAEAFKLICDKYNIPCVYISGTADGVGHGWNAVQMDDGNWYFVDITWDDQTDSSYPVICDDFFLVGSNSKDIHFDGKAFSSSHVADTNLFLPALKYATEKYTQTNHCTEFGATYNSYAVNSEKVLVRSFFDANDSNIYYNGMYVDLLNTATNAEITIPNSSGNNEETWKIAFIGDCNGDALANADDLAIAVNKVMSDAEIETIYDYAADAHNDGYLDAIDLALLERAISGLNTNITIE